MAKSLAERITSARSSDRVTIADLETVIADATAERERMSAASVAASAESVDFRFTDDERDEQAAKAERYSRTAKALDGAIAELAEKLGTKRNSAAQQAKAKEAAEVVAERDALAERLRTEWPVIEATVLEILDAIVANNARLRELRLPEPEAEQVARVCGPMPGVGGAPRSLTDLRLPSFANVRDYAWPRPSNFNPDLGRAQMLAERARMQAERERWKRYMVTPPAGLREPLTIDTKGGGARLRNTPAILIMSEEQASAAKKLKCRVRLAGATESVGLPAMSNF